MAKTAPFDAHPDRYDDWFDRHDAAYRSERRAIRTLLPDHGEGMEIGVGTGRFAAPLGLEHGVDPSRAMRKRARERGIEVRAGTAENLPYPDARFDAVLMTTTLCYLDSPATAFSEAKRVLRPDGTFVVAFVDRNRPLGQHYAEKRDDNVFYKPARFHAAPDVVVLFQDTGFGSLRAQQTLFSDPDTMTEPDPVREGYGTGSFVVIRGENVNG
jgi:SAM-dependent methyltransferase